jgi:hypothetical protein
MPNLIETNYNFYDILEFKIYKISDKIQFIIETNPKTKNNSLFIAINE